MNYEVELVGKIGSMALIDSVHHDLDYNKFARISRFLRPGMIWVSSGAAEIGRLDYIKRHGVELSGDMDTIKTDYASQGQAILMQTYRNFVDSRYSIRQVLLEHYHFNDIEKREHIKNLLLRAITQQAIPIINYNDCVSNEETRKVEIRKLLATHKKVVELVDNDETASQVACLVHAKRLVILTNLEGIYQDLQDKKSLIREISGKDVYEVLENIDRAKALCEGASRKGANGAKAKLEYIKPCIMQGTEVIIASSDYDIEDIINGKVRCTRIGVR